MPYPYITTRQVEFSDTDAGGIMHFTSYFKYMEQVEHEMLRQTGLSVFTEIDGQMISWPRVSSEFDYKRPSVFEDQLTIGIGIERMGSKSVTYVAEFRRGDELLATGRIVAACCRVEHGKPPVAIEIPEVIKSKLQSMTIPAS